MSASAGSAGKHPRAPLAFCAVLAGDKGHSVPVFVSIPTGFTAPGPQLAVRSARAETLESKLLARRALAFSS